MATSSYLGTVVVTSNGKPLCRLTFYELPCCSGFWETLSPWQQSPTLCPTCS